VEADGRCGYPWAGCAEPGSLAFKPDGEGDVLAQLHFLQVFDGFGAAQGRQEHVAEALGVDGLAQLLAVVGGVEEPAQDIGQVKVVG